MPTFTWEPPLPVGADELLGDEGTIVRARLDSVDGVPEGQEGHLRSVCPPEVMRSAPGSWKNVRGLYVVCRRVSDRGVRTVMTVLPKPSAFHLQPTRKTEASA